MKKHQKILTINCPECNSDNFRVITIFDSYEHRQCNKCEQEYFTDVIYPLNKNTKER